MAGFRNKVLIGEDEEYVPSWDRDPNKATGVIAGQAQVVTDSSGLRLRDAPISGNVLTEMPKGVIVNLGPSDTPGWAYVEWNGFSGFASTQYLAPVGGPAHDNLPPPIPVVPDPPPQPAPPGPTPEPNPFVPPPPPRPAPQPKPAEPSPLPEPPAPGTQDHTLLYAGLGAAGVLALIGIAVWAKKRHG